MLTESDAASTARATMARLYRRHRPRSRLARHGRRRRPPPRPLASPVRPAPPPPPRPRAGWRWGAGRPGPRSHFRAMGIDPDRLDGPVVGIASTWTQTMPCNLNHRRLAAGAAAAVEAAG